MIGKLICWWKGKHARGKSIAATQGHVIYQCPRCKATWQRAARRKAAP